MHVWKNMFLQKCWGWAEAQQEVKERWRERIGCIIEGVYTIGLCISRFLSEKVCSTQRRKTGIKTRRQILQGHLAPNAHSGKKGSIARNYPEVGTSWAWSLRAIIRGEVTTRNLAPRTMRPQSSMGFGETIYKLKSADKATFYSSIEAKVMTAPTSKSPEEWEFVVDSGASVHMMRKKDLRSDDLDTSRRSRNLTVVLTPQWRSEYKRGSTSIRSRPQSLRDSAITRRNACCSIAWKTLRRPRIFLWVGQRSKTTFDQRREDNYMQNGQLRTSYCSRVIHQFW